MSAAEIADNKWELQATKPPVGTFAGLTQLLLMAGFGVFFLWIIVYSIIAIVTPHKEGAGLEGQFQKMGTETAPAEAVPE